MLPVQSLVILSAAGLIGLAIVAAVGAWSWRGWLQLQLHRTDHAPRGGGDYPAIGARIDLADMKERIRKLEAIAAGVDI